MNKPTLTTALVLGMLQLLGGCGGGGGSETGEVDATVVGPISAFGSVVVAGVRFDDSQATVVFGDTQRSRDQLRIGMVVQVQGRLRNDGTGVANRIQYQDCVTGPITAIHRVQNTMTVLGQVVQADGDTVFDGVTLRDMNAFAIGDLVEVSCLPAREQERLRATRIERKGTFVNGSSDLEVTGTVSNLNLALGTCTVGSMTLDFSGLAAAQRPAGLANGMTVEAAGRRIANGLLLTERLRDRDRDRIGAPDGNLYEVEGLVSSFVSIANFKVDGTLVDASRAAIRNGTAADIRTGVRLEVEGSMTAGVLVAQVVVIKLQSNVQVEAGMQAKNSAQATFTLLGRAFRVVADTVITDRTGDTRQPRLITLAALGTGDRLEVRGLRDASGNLIAARVERTQADPLVVVKGVADAKSPLTQLTLAGFTVATGPGSRYRDLDGNLIDGPSFYQLVQVAPAVPTVVHARGVVATLTTNVVDSTRSTSTIGELEIATP